MTITAQIVINILDEVGGVTVEQLVEATGFDIKTVRGILGTLRKRSYVQSFKKPKEPVRYAPTTKIYTGHRERYRTPVMWFANDGTCWVLPSIQKYADIRGIANAQVWKSITRGWKIRGERIVELEYVK